MAHRRGVLTGFLSEEPLGSCVMLSQAVMIGNRRGSVYVVNAYACLLFAECKFRSKPLGLKSSQSSGL